jgi:hypothetical protein
MEEGGEQGSRLLRRFATPPLPRASAYRRLGLRLASRWRRPASRRRPPLIAGTFVGLPSVDDLWLHWCSRARALLLLYNCCLCARVVWIRHDVQEQYVALEVFTEMEADSFPAIIPFGHDTVVRISLPRYGGSQEAVRNLGSRQVVIWTYSAKWRLFVSSRNSISEE